VIEVCVGGLINEIGVHPVSDPAHRAGAKGSALLGCFLALRNGPPK